MAFYSLGGLPTLNSHSRVPFVAPLRWSVTPSLRASSSRSLSTPQALLT